MTGSWFRSSGVKPEGRLRSRWPVFCSALLLLWCAGWYCKGESPALFGLAAGFSLIAWARSRALPGTARWVIWSGILLSLLFLAANLSRIVPPESAWAESRTIDRAITLTFAWGVTALFFMPSTSWVTLILVGGLPMVMVVLGRGSDDPGVVGDHGTLVVWGVIVLMALVDQAQRLTGFKPVDRTGPGMREVIWRVAIIGCVVLAAAGLRLPVEKGIRIVRHQVSGWMFYTGRAYQRRSGDLLLDLPTPLNFGRRMRLVMVLDGDRMPGYLRERVYTTYQSGRWLAGKAEQIMERSEHSPAMVPTGIYPLIGTGDDALASTCRVDILSPDMVDAFCLSGHTIALICEGASPVRDANGMVLPYERMPASYQVRVMPGRLLQAAFPQPDGQSDPLYLNVPETLAGAVSNWVVQFEGLREAGTAVQAVRLVERYFDRAFNYRLGVRLRSRPDPLINFMEQREGTCTYFASAAALMFRSCGIPARVIGGFVCVERNPWADRWVVREREGHAWVEVWDSSTMRWLVADPTPPDGQPAAWPQSGYLRRALDVWRIVMKRVVAYIRDASLLEVIAAASETLIFFLWHVVWSLPGAVVFAGAALVGWLRWRAGQRQLTHLEQMRVTLTREMCRIEKRLTPAPLRRRKSESWDQWLNRIGPELPRSRLEKLQQALAGYQTLRYRRKFTEHDARTWLEAARQLRR